MGLGVVATAAQATVPAYEYYGEWRSVSYVLSLGRDEPSVSFGMIQRYDDTGVSLHWDGGDVVTVSATADTCNEEEDGFRVHYDVSTAKWLEDQRATRLQVKADMKAWLKQIEFVCDRPGIASKFKFTHFNQAFNAFTDAFDD